MSGELTDFHAIIMRPPVKPDRFSDSVDASASTLGLDPPFGVLEVSRSGRDWLVAVVAGDVHWFHPVEGWPSDQITEAG